MKVKKRERDKKLLNKKLFYEETDGVEREEQDKHQKDVLFTAARLFSQQSLISKTKSFVFLYTHTFTREDASLFE